MSNSNEVIEVAREYPAESYGSRVGWASINNLSAGEVFRVDLVTASVGLEGASEAIVESDPLGRRLLTGFDNVKGFELLLWQEKEDEDGANIRYQHGHEITIPSDGSKSGKYIITGNWLDTDDVGVLSRDVDSRTAFLSLIKQGLNRAGAGEFYPDVYFFLNGSLAHPSRVNPAQHSPAARNALFYPDPSMTPTTIELLNQAHDVEETLEVEYRQNQLLLKVLATLKGNYSGALPQIFRDSRIGVANLEASISDIVKSSPFRDFIVKPVGSQRKRPYMDATEVGERGFEEELRALSSGDIDTVQSEIVREMQEIRYRFNYAWAGGLMLADLALAECNLGNG